MDHFSLHARNFCGWVFTRRRYQTASVRDMHCPFLSIFPSPDVIPSGNAAAKAVEVVGGISVPIELTDREALIKCASTSLNSKVVSQYAGKLAPMVVDAVLKVQHDGNCDLRDIKVTICFVPTHTTLAD